MTANKFYNFMYNYYNKVEFNKLCKEIAVTYYLQIVTNINKVILYFKDHEIFINNIINNIFDYYKNINEIIKLYNINNKIALFYIFNLYYSTYYKKNFIVQSLSESKGNKFYFMKDINN